MTGAGPQINTRFIKQAGPAKVNLFSADQKPVQNSGSKKLPWLKLFGACLALAGLVYSSNKLFSPAQIKSSLGMNAAAAPVATPQPTAAASQPALSAPTVLAATTTASPAPPAPITTTPLSQKSVKISSTPTGYLNVRSQPSTSGLIIGKVYPGETHDYSETKNGWYLITLKSGKTGWINSQYTTDSENYEDGE